MELIIKNINININIMFSNIIYKLIKIIIIFFLNKILVVNLSSKS
jgi:hypothetical protein